MVHSTCLRAADLHAGKRIGNRHAQVVVAMHRPYRAIGVRNALPQGADELPVQLGHRVADGVGNVDGRGPFVDHRLQHPAQEVKFGTVAVLGRELDVRTQVSCKADRQAGLLVDLFGRHAQLLLHVQRTGCDEGVDARPRSALERFGRSRDVAVVGSRQRADGRLADRIGDRLHRGKVAVGRRCEARFDHIHPQPLQLSGNAQLLVPGHRGPRRLLTVAQGRVEDDQ
jgi:hypothetical protein